MILRPTGRDIKAIGWGIGRVVLGVGLLMTIPLVVSVCCGEWDTALDFLISLLACLSFWLSMEALCGKHKDLTWFQGMVITSGGWLMATLLGAVPHWLSGHFGSYLDAFFDVMSGYTTTGLFLLQDLDHLSHGMNMWRHLLSYAGGQGIIVIALTFLFVGSSGALRIYVAEGKEERLLPNVINTSRAIWKISLTYLAVGVLFLWAALIREGMALGRGFLHSVWLFMGAWSTGGFAPQSLNLLYYHSLLVEILTLGIFVLGSLNFALHFAVWSGNRKEIWRNVEWRSFMVTLLTASVLMSIGFLGKGLYCGPLVFFRRGLYNLLSAHTTTGNSNIYSVSFLKDFGFPAMAAVMLAMAIGASACSTGGGFKGLRMGILFRSLRQDVRRILSPESAVVEEKVHHIRDIWLGDAVVRGAVFIVLCYVILYFVGGVLGSIYGYTPSVAFFDSISAGSNTGLSAGLVGPSMPAPLKVFYVFSMWAGRLEFVSVFALAGFLGAFLKGRRAKGA